MIQDVQEGGYGIVAKVHCKSRHVFACKMFKTHDDPEIDFLGGCCASFTIDKEKQHSTQAILSGSGFLSTKLFKAHSSVCNICKHLQQEKRLSNIDQHMTIGDYATNVLSNPHHFHVVMPWMDGDLEKYMSQHVLTLEEAVDIFLQVSKVSQEMAKHDILNIDLKPPNVVYKLHTNGKPLFKPCDVGGLYRTGEHHLEYRNDEFKRMMIVNNNNNQRRIIGQVDEDDTEEYVPCQPHETASEHVWAVATCVNIYLKLQGTKNNFDLSASTHLTNQFSVLSFLMIMIGIQPPWYTIANSTDTLTNTLRMFPHMDSYLEHHASRKFQNHASYTNLIQIIKKVWRMSNNWTLYGDKHTYIANLRRDVKLVVHGQTKRGLDTTDSDVTQHTPPPCKILRRAVLDDQTLVRVPTTHTQESVHSNVVGR